MLPCEGAGWDAQGILTSVEHGAVAELCPVPTTAHQGVVGDHGSVVASPTPAAFGAPPPVRLRERQRWQGRAGQGTAGSHKPGVLSFLCLTPWRTLLLT